MQQFMQHSESSSTAECVKEGEGARGGVAVAEAAVSSMGRERTGVVNTGGNDRQVSHARWYLMMMFWRTVPRMQHPKQGQIMGRKHEETSVRKGRGGIWIHGG